MPSERALALTFDLKLIYTGDDPKEWERAVNAREVFQLPPLDQPRELFPPREVSPRWAVAPRLFALYMKGHAP